MNLTKYTNRNLTKKKKFKPEIITKHKSKAKQYISQFLLQTTIPRSNI